MGEGERSICVPVSGFQQQGLLLTTGHQGLSLGTQGLRPTPEMAPFIPHEIIKGRQADPNPEKLDLGRDR